MRVIGLYKYIVLFADGTSDWFYAEDKSEAYEIALDRFEKQIADIWRD
jgi:hypothetical protein